MVVGSTSATDMLMLILFSVRLNDKKANFICTFDLKLLCFSLIYDVQWNCCSKIIYYLA
jgi:hypothetical protein